MVDLDLNMESSVPEFLLRTPHLLKYRQSQLLIFPYQVNTWELKYGFLYTDE